MTRSQNSKTRGQIRSISLPIRSHPATLRVDEELNKVKSFESASITLTSSTISNGLSGLEKLYKCIDDLLNVSSTQQIISHYKLEKWVDDLLDGPVRLLDTCGGIIDIVSQIKEQIGDVRSCLRRRKGDSNIESSIAKFTSFRKKMKKDAKKLISSLKKMDKEIGECQIANLDHHVSEVIRVLREVSVTNISIFKSLLVFLSVPILKSSRTKWSLVPNLMRKGRVACEGQFDNMNEVERVDVALSNVCKSGAIETMKIQIAQKRLKVLDGQIEEIKYGLECIFRRLIRTRASFLNIISH